MGVGEAGRWGGGGGGVEARRSGGGGGYFYRKGGRRGSNSYCNSISSVLTEIITVCTLLQDSALRDVVLNTSGRAYCIFSWYRGYHAEVAHGTDFTQMVVPTAPSPGIESTMQRWAW